MLILIFEPFSHWESLSHSGIPTLMGAEVSLAFPQEAASGLCSELLGSNPCSLPAPLLRFNMFIPYATRPVSGALPPCCRRPAYIPAPGSCCEQLPRSAPQHEEHRSSSHRDLQLQLMGVLLQYSDVRDTQSYAMVYCNM